MTTFHFDQRTAEIRAQAAEAVTGSADATEHRRAQAINANTEAMLLLAEQAARIADHFESETHRP